MRGLGLGLGLQRRNTRGGGSGNDPAMDAYLTRLAAASDTMSAPNQELLNAWYVSSAAYRSHIARCNFFMSDTILGVVVPQINTFGDTVDTNHFFTALDYGITTGLQGDGTGKWIGTGVRPFEQGIAPTGLGEFAWCVDEFVDDIDRFLMGSLGGGGSNDRTDFGLNASPGTAILAAVLGNPGLNPSCVTYDGVAVANSDTLLGIQAIAGALQFFVAGVPSVTGTGGTNSAWVGNTAEIAVFCRNNDGTPINYWAGKIGAYVITNGMTALEIAAMYADLHTLMQGLGRVP